MSRQILSLPLLLLTLGAAACGSTGSSPTTGATSPSGLTADAICAAANTKINAITGPTTDPTTLTDASQLAPYATYLDQVTAAATQEQTDLAAAPDGSSLTAPFATLMTKLNTLDAAAKGTDLAAFNSANTDFATANTAFHAAGQAANMPNCAK